MNELDQLLTKYNTDKSSLFHNYSKVYFEKFKGRRLEQLTLLEIGVLEGASIKAWYDFFPNANIVGADLGNDCQRFSNDRIFIEIGDATTPEFLETITKKYSFDIIIDDGSHRWIDQRVSFEFLFQKLTPGGIYVVEDLSTSYLKGSVWDTGAPSMIEFIKERIDDLNLNGKSICGVLEVGGKELNYYEKWLEELTFFKGVCLFQKRKVSL